MQLITNNEMTRDYINQQTISINNEIIDKNRQGLNEICQELSTVKEMFGELHILIENQGEQLYIIDNNIQQSINNAKQAKNEIHKMF